MWNDLKLAFRQLRLNRGFAFVAVATLALGIGANTAIFTVMNTVMLRPLPYKNPDALVTLHRTSAQSDQWPHSIADFLDIQRESAVFEKMAAYIWGRFSLANPGEPAESVRGLSCTADFFNVLGIPAALGRTFTPEEDQPGRDHVAVISYSFWKHRYGGDPAIIGKTIRIEGEPVQVIGVMPQSFDVPQLWSPIEVWRPLVFGAEDRQDRRNHYIRAMGRIKAGILISQANAHINVIGERLAKNHPESSAQTGLRLAPLKENIGDRSSRRMAWMMFGLTLFILMIACVNLANLQLARAAARARELAVRLALGAGRARLMRQLLVESLVISALGGVAGVLISMWLANFLGKQLDRWSPAGIAMPVDWRVLTFALLCAVFTGLVFGIGPAWTAARSNVNEALKSGARGSTSDHTQNHFRHALIVGQVSLALILLTGAALFTTGLRKFITHNPGWDPENLLAGWVPASSKFEDHNQFAKTLEQRIGEVPGVRSVSVSSSLPIWSFGSSRYVAIDGQPLPEVGREPLITAEAVSPSYFNTMGIALKQGRLFTADDSADHRGVVIINEAMAQRFFAGRNPIGQKLRTGDRRAIEEDAPVEIVGVVGDLRFPANLNRQETLWQTYRPFAQETRGYMAVEVRTQGAPEPIIAAVRRAVADVDPDLPVNELDTARATIDRALGHFKLCAQILTAFSYLGLTLAALGIYGVMSYLVIQRTGEIGIRMALGARAGHIASLLLSRAMLLTAIGILLGLIAAAAVAKLLAAAVPEVPTHDLWTNVTVCITVVIVTLAAVAHPAIKAMRVDPSVSLRNE